MIAEQDIAAIAGFVARQGPAADLAERLRAAWPDYHFTCCSDDDISAARPIRSGDDFKLYLVSGTGGCIGFVSDPGQATGLVVAEVEPDEEEA